MTAKQFRMASNVKILLVDDNPMVLGMLQEALAPLGRFRSLPTAPMPC
jgi:CheY-like chemotaxis protein